MQLVNLVLFLIAFIGASAMAQIESKNTILQVSPKSCVAYTDTIAALLADQPAVILRYSFLDHDSMDCYVISKMPDTKSLVGEDFFYNFAASLMVRSLLYSKMISSVITGTYSNKPFKGFEPSTANQFDRVWADVEGITVNAQEEPNIQLLATNHDRVRAQEGSYYQNSSLDSFIAQKAGIKSRPEGGWIHFSFVLTR